MADQLSHRPVLGLELKLLLVGHRLDRQQYEKQQRHDGIEPVERTPCGGGRHDGRDGDEQQQEQQVYGDEAEAAA